MEADKKKGYVNSGEKATPVSYDTSGTPSVSLPEKTESSRHKPAHSGRLARIRFDTGKPSCLARSTNRWYVASSM